MILSSYSHSIHSWNNRTRTDDIFLVREARYQLRHAPIVENLWTDSQPHINCITSCRFSASLPIVGPIGSTLCSRLCCMPVHRHYLESSAFQNAVVSKENFHSPMTTLRCSKVVIAPPTGFEPVTYRLTADCSAVELQGIIVVRTIIGMNRISCDHPDNESIGFTLWSSQISSTCFSRL